MSSTARGLLITILVALVMPPSAFGLDLDQGIQVGAHPQERNDQQGHRWDLRPDGQINDGTNDLFDGGMQLRLQVGGLGQMQFNANGQSIGVLPNTDEYVALNRSLGNGIELMRRIRLFPQQSCMRYVELVENSGKQKLVVDLQVYSNLGTSVQNMSLNGTQSLQAQSGSWHPVGEDLHYLAANQSGSRPSALFHLGQATKRCRIRVKGNGDDLWLSWRFNIAPGERVAIVHALVQAPSGQSSLSKEMLDFLQASEFLDDLPDDIRAALVNRAIQSQAPVAIWDLGGMNVPHSDRDSLAVQADQYLRGDAGWQAATYIGAFGETGIGFDDVAALMALPTGSGQVTFLRDGHILVGDLRVDGFFFDLPNGYRVLEGIERLDRLFGRHLEDEGPQPPGWAVTLRSGTRLLLHEAPAQALGLVTPWGGLQVASEDLIGVYATVDDPVGFQRVHLRNGTLLPVLPSDDQWRLTTQRFGPIDVASASVASLYCYGSEAETDIAERLGPGQVLCDIGRSFHLVGQPDWSMVTLQGERPMRLPLDQIASIDTGDWPDCSVALWDGTAFDMRWQRRTLPIRVDDQVLEVPGAACDRLVFAPPDLRPIDRARLMKLIEQLGDPAWRQREAAMTAIGDLGLAARATLEKEIEHRTDPEIVFRLRRLIRAVSP